MDKDIDLPKVNKTSPNLLVGRLNDLKRLFPDLFDGEGNLNETELKNLISEYNNPQVEKFTFEWAGKASSKKLAFKPSKATLTPNKERSIDFENTENLIIEGDNLEVLKLLQKSYYEKVKCIYIDPPYNTGNDFIYTDDYTESKKAYWEKNGQVQDGVKMDSNTESNGRLHSNWLDMMQSRLLLARKLLREDGVIFVSIDDNEGHNLRKLLDEVFGGENFVAQFIWKSRQNVDSRSLNGVSNDHEYILCYFKSNENRLRGREIDKSKYKNTDNDPRGDWMNSALDGIATKDKRPNLHYTIVNPETNISYNPNPANGWRFQMSTMDKLMKERRLLWPKNNKSKPRFKRYLNELGSHFTGFSSILSADFTLKGTRELRDLMEMETLKFPKPASLMKTIIEQASNGNDIVLDFFAGSGTTAHAVMDLNKEDGDNRKFILIQLPEYTDEKSEAYKAGYKRISDITIERVKRAGERIKKEKRDVDTGFKVFSLTHSNFRENTWKSDSNLTEKENIKVFQAYLNKADQPSLFEDANKPESIITEVALKQGYPLNFTFKKLNDFDKNTVYRIKGDSKEMLLCLDKTIHDDTVDQLLEFKDVKFICQKIALNTTHRWKLNKQFGKNLEVI